jgi:hypothetical protein
VTDRKLQLLSAELGSRTIMPTLHCFSKTKASTNAPPNKGQAKRNRAHVWLFILGAFICVCFYNWIISGNHIEWIHGNPSIEQRARKILTDNPLIGAAPQSFA